VGHPPCHDGAFLRPKVNLVDQLGKLKLKPESIKYVGISYYHADHTGQVDSFPKSTLLIGQGRLGRADRPGQGAAHGQPRHFRALDQRRQQGRADPLRQGRVRRRHRRHAHTPGHHSLLVRGEGSHGAHWDTAHFRENYDTNAVPSFNTHRGGTLASLDRLNKIAADIKATVIIQHDERDGAKLPALPAAAK
jgi:glyoxylase-like metal-dependent hydrolase (beta-lactamase superfamily II)